VLKLRNTDKARDWMDMAEYDLEDAELDLQHGRFPSAVYHAQQASEKACKALLALFGVEAGKTHFPSELLREIASEEKAPPSISGKLEEVLLYARTLEDQRTAPRYRWETPQEELVEDLITIISHFAGKLYGMRSRKYRKVVEGAKQLIRDP